MEVQKGSLEEKQERKTVVGEKKPLRTVKMINKSGAGNALMHLASARRGVKMQIRRIEIANAKSARKIASYKEK